MAYRMALDHLPSEGRRVLIAEDEANIRRLLQIQLEKCGCKVTATEDGQQALDALEAGDFDIVILDVMMPYVDGITVLKQIRTNPKTENLPVVLLTVKAQDHDIYEGYREGADMYLTKPFNPQEILEVVCPKATAG